MKIINRIGEINYNYNGEKMEIINYESFANITVRFEDGNIRKGRTYKDFKNGSIKNLMSPSVCGVGIIGDEKARINGKHSKEYATWRRMLARCYQCNNRDEFSMYKECSVCDEWLYFPNFKKWCHEQENWNIVMRNPANFQLDKDIISKGNKIYSPDNCCFVPKDVNSLFTKSNKTRGDLPIGVSKHKNKYRVQHKKGYLVKKSGSHVVDTIEEAFQIYKYEKEETIKLIAEKEFKNNNITRRCYEAMMKYEVEITD